MYSPETNTFYDEGNSPLVADAKKRAAAGKMESQNDHAALAGGLDETGGQGPLVADAKKRAAAAAKK